MCRCILLQIIAVSKWHRLLHPLPEDVIEGYGFGIAHDARPIDWASRDRDFPLAITVPIASKRPGNHTPHYRYFSTSPRQAWAMLIALQQVKRDGIEEKILFSLIL